MHDDDDWNSIVFMRLHRWVWCSRGSAELPYALRVCDVSRGIRYEVNKRTRSFASSVILRASITVTYAQACTVAIIAREEVLSTPEKWAKKLRERSARSTREVTRTTAR